MKLLLDHQRVELVPNSKANAMLSASGLDEWHFNSVVKLFCPWGAATHGSLPNWTDEDTAFGLCDLGVGCPELGYVSLRELEQLTGPGGSVSVFGAQDGWASMPFIGRAKRR